MDYIGLEIIYATFAVVFGGALIAVSIGLWNEIGRYLGKSLGSKLTVVKALLYLFFVGYIWFLFILWFKIDITKELVVSTVFGGGGVFVFLIMKLFYDSLLRLKSTTTRLETLFNTAGDSMFVVEGAGPDAGIIVDANRTAEEVHGYGPGELLGRHISELDCEEDAHLVPGMLEELERTGQLRGQIRHVKRDGTVFPVDVTATKIEVDGRELILAIDRDETERMEAEALALHLQGQMAHSQKMQAVGALASGIAHDFNNLLQGILGFTEALKDNAEPRSEDWHSLRKIESAGQRAAELVQNLLSFSRLNPEKFCLTNPKSLVREATALLGRTIPKMINIEASVCETVSHVHGDPTQLQQVLLNLATNARDAMPLGGTLTIRAEDVVLDQEYCEKHVGAHPGEFVHLTVSDTGTGIEPEKLDSIFKPFFTTKGEGEGTGLGLSTVYGVVKNHDGYINCNSVLGKGTVFDIYLPVAGHAQQQDANSLGNDTLTLTREGTVLVVDDEEVVREVAMLALERDGYKVIEADSGEKALEVFSDNGGNIDVIVMDLNMPGMGGRACVGEMRKISSDVKILITTGYGASAQVDNVLKEGADKYLQKPYRARLLSSTVAELLE